MPIDFDEIRINAAAAGISLSEIAIFYENLTALEIGMLDSAGLVTHITNKQVIGRFKPDGSVMFPEKAVKVYTLAS